LFCLYGLCTICSLQNFRCLESPRSELFFLHTMPKYVTVYLAPPNKKFYRIKPPQNDRCRASRTHRTHNTTHKKKMSRCLPTPSGFALYLHGNICHGPKSWFRGSPQVCCRCLAVGLLLPQLVPLVGMPNKDASKNRERDGSPALGGRHLRHNNQPIVGGIDRRDDGEDAQLGWSVRGGSSYIGAAN
jgi:hypothetical protein